MATARPKSTRRRAGAASRPRPRASSAKPSPKASSNGHGRELAAIACVAVAVFLAFVIYLGWDGGAMGRWVGGAARWLVGLLVYALPLLLCFVAYLLLARGEQRPRRGLTWGLGLVVAAFLLAAAADAFGIFSSDRPVALYRDTYMTAHGGVTGETLWGVTHPFIGSVGVDVLVLALFFAGALLVTGSSLRQWAGHSKRGVAAAGRAARGQAEAFGARRRDAAETRVLELDESPTLDGSEHVRTSVVTVPEFDQVPEYLPPVPPPSEDLTSAPRGPRLIDGVYTAPELYGGMAPAPPEPDDLPPRGTHEPPPNHEDEAAELGEQLSLAEASADGPEAAEAAVAFQQAEKRCWVLPDAALLQRIGDHTGESPDAIRNVSERLVETLGHFGVTATVIGTVSGPRVTRYELQLAPGIKVSRVASLKDDLAYALAATDIRVQAPIPGKTAVGVEVPNIQANYVSLGDVHQLFPQNASPMAFWLGKDVSGKAVMADLVPMVHLLVAGTTGSGKSGCLNALITSVLLRATPEEVRMIMIDPKKVELSAFDGVPHLLAPVITNPKQATYALDNLTREMDRRYDVLSRNGCQHIRALNKKLAKAGDETMPYIMVVVDELADLMMAAPSEVEDSIIRLGQLGRSCGIHLVVATQRPSVDVVTGMIKTNIPSRIAFAVASQTDSRIILDQGGAESLLGMGDMLFSPLGSNKLLRVQGALITAHEMKLITEHWRRQAKPDFREDLLENPAGPDADQPTQAAGGDELLAEAIKTVVMTGAASVALLQRRLRVGYARAGRLVDIMEEMGIISGYDGSKARAVLIDESGLQAALARVAGDEKTVEAAEAEPPEEADEV
jgi:DNA segregation ATPase FtsK/SpoIIIE, S-DNA-T family